MREKFGVKVLKSEGRGGRKRGRRVSCIFSDFYLFFVLFWLGRVGEGCSTGMRLEGGWVEWDLADGFVGVG